MAITVKHKFVSAIPDAGDSTIVQPSNWNDDHDLVGTIPVANGGTGAATLTGYVKGNGTSAMTAASTIPNTDITGLGTMSTQNSNNISVTGGSISGTTVLGYIPTTEKAAALGVATLDAGGTVPLSQIPASIQGGVSYQGTWNASTNTPTLSNGVGTKGYYYVVSVAGNTNLDGITAWNVGDWAIFNGTVWQKVDNTDAVTSVNGYTGTVNLTYTDVGAFPATSTTGTGNVVLATGSTQANPTISNYENFTPTSAPSYSEGRVWYDSSQHTLAYYNDATNNLVHVGQEVQIKVVNNTGSTITIGAPVYVTSTPSGQIYPNVALAKADSVATSSVLGLATQAIANGAIGYVTAYGILQPCNTGTFNVGDVLYLSPYSAGVLMNTIPPTGNAIIVGVVAYKNTPNGSIYVKQENSYIVSAGTITGQVAVANGGTGASTLTGYVKGSGTSVMTASSTIPTTDLSGTVTNAQLANSAITINGTSTSLGGSISVGTVTSVTGTSPVVSSGGNTPAISMPAATTSVNGYLTSTDWNTFNSKGSGTVTSVGLSAPAMFTVSGSPVTGSGTLALSYSGTALPIANGGTGQTTANDAFNALAPSQTSNAGKYLTTNGTTTSWETVGGTTYTRTSFTATASQTTFSVTYTVGLIEVYVNGVLLNGADYTASNGTSVVLAEACSAGDIVETIAFASFSVANTVSSLSGGTTGLTPSSPSTGNVVLAGTLAVANGGTGVTTSTGSGANVLGTSPTLASPTISGAVLSSMASSVITSGTAQASTSGTIIEFTGIPNWVKRITVMFNGVSTNGTALVIVQIGSTTYTTSGYLSSGSQSGASNQVTGLSATTGFLTTAGGNASNIASGATTLTNITGNTWISSASMGFTNTTFGGVAGGTVALSGVLDRVRVTTVGGTNTFDAGSINIMYE